MSALIGLWITLIAIGGGVTIGAMMIVGVMLHSGKWALPNSEQRKIQQANTRKAIAELDLVTAEAHFRREQFEANRALLQAKSLQDLADAQEAHFRKQLGTGKEA